jgi:uncharacterized surface protein with fasciclin (FAS1) repeats
MIRRLKALFLAGAVSLLVACGDSDNPTPNIVDSLKADPKYSVLVEAVTAADLATTLSGPGPFTVFAPTNDAFVKLLQDLGVTKDQAFADKALLSTILTYHVLPSSVAKAQVPVGKPITTVQGGIFKVDAVGGDLVINDGRNRKSKIIGTDLIASNGLIHTIDTVILPADKNIAATAIASAPEFSTLVAAVQAADPAVLAALTGPGPLTVFAPTNAAFASLLAELGLTADQLLADKTTLNAVLTYHVVPGLVLKADVPVGTPIKTVQGGTFTVGAGLAITDARARKSNITATDILASNGVIHVIDKVILP